MESNTTEKLKIVFYNSSILLKKNNMTDLDEEFTTSSKIKLPTLCRNDMEILAFQYEIITNKLYRQQSEQEVMRDIEAVGIFLQVEAQMYNFSGLMADIHAAFVVEDYDDFKPWELVGYIRIMHYDIDEDILERGIHLEIATMLIQKQYERLEKLRIHKYINAVLFQPMLKKPDEFPGILFWHEEPSKSKIIENGVFYYYPRMGEITIEVLTDIFDYQELLHIAMIFGQQRAGKSKLRKVNKNDIRFIPTNLTSTDEIARAVMLFVEDAEFDPRVFLTPQGFNNTFIQEESEQPISINPIAYINPEDLSVVCSEEGILLYDTISNEIKPDNILFEEYTVTQLSPAFMSNVGEHRSVYGAVRRHRMPSSGYIHDLALGEMLFFGKRDGLNPVDAYSVKELYFSFKENHNFWDPESLRLWPQHSLMWVSFSRISINRLLYKILPKMERTSEYAKKLSFVIKDIINEDSKKAGLMSKRAENLQNLLLDTIKNDLKNQLSGVYSELDEINNNTDKLKMFFIRMFNVGNIFREVDEMVETYDPVLLADMMMVNPLSQPPEPKWTGRVRAELRDLLMRIYETFNVIDDGIKSLLERLRIFRYWDNTLHVNYENDSYTIGAYLEITFDFIRLGLFKQLKIVGLNLMMTGSYYHKLIFGINLTDIKLEHSEINSFGGGETEFYETDEFYEAD